MLLTTFNNLFLSHFIVIIFYNFLLKLSLIICNKIIANNKLLLIIYDHEMIVYIREESCSSQVNSFKIIYYFIKY